MENPARTSKYLSEREARMGALRAELAELFRGRGHAHECIVLEVGCGHGHFLTAYAAAHPKKFCVGFDIVLDRIVRAGRKRTRAELEKNLAFVRAEATEFFAALPEHVRFSEIFILFPDPWPKRRHHKNRMIRPEILSALAERAVGAGAADCAFMECGDLSPLSTAGLVTPPFTSSRARATSGPPAKAGVLRGLTSQPVQSGDKSPHSIKNAGGAATRLYFRTDHAPYFADARQTIAEHGEWKIAPAGTPWPFEFQTVFQSRAAGFQSLIAFSSAGKK